MRPGASCSDEVLRRIQQARSIRPFYTLNGVTSALEDHNETNGAVQILRWLESIGERVLWPSEEEELGVHLQSLSSKRLLASELFYLYHSHRAVNLISDLKILDAVGRALKFKSLQARCKHWKCLGWLAEQR